VTYEKRRRCSTAAGAPRVSVRAAAAPPQSFRPAAPHSQHARLLKRGRCAAYGLPKRRTGPRRPVAGQSSEAPAPSFCKSDLPFR
jgi:hypothetical protein